MRRVRWVVAATISYNVIEAVVAITAGRVASSGALVAFGSWFERRTGRELGSASAVADSKQTLLCSYLSAVLLVGLLLSTTLGWAWADPVAALVIAGVAIKEGLEAWRGDACCTPASVLVSDISDQARACTGGCCDDALTERGAS